MAGVTSTRGVMPATGATTAEPSSHEGGAGAGASGDIAGALGSVFGVGRKE